MFQASSFVWESRIPEVVACGCLHSQASGEQMFFPAAGDALKGVAGKPVDETPY